MEPPFVGKLTSPLLKGDHIKIGFAFETGEVCPTYKGFSDGRESEWMWLEVTNISGDKIEGKLLNKPFCCNGVKFGDTISCEKENIYSVNYDSPLRN